MKECNETARSMERMEELLILSQQLDFKEVRRAVPLISASRWLVKRLEKVTRISWREGALEGGHGSGAAARGPHRVGPGQGGLHVVLAHDGLAGHVLPDFRRQLLPPHAENHACRAAILQIRVFWADSIDHFLQ